MGDGDGERARAVPVGKKGRAGEMQRCEIESRARVLFLNRCRAGTGRLQCVLGFTLMQGVECGWLLWWRCV